MIFVKGFNSDICFKGCSYHVQTEDWDGTAKASIVTKVFKNGAVVKTITTDCEAITSVEGHAPTYDNSNDLEHIRLAMQNQHRTVLAQLFH